MWTKALAGVEWMVERVAEATLSFDPLIPAKAGTQMDQATQMPRLDPRLCGDERNLGEWAVAILLTNDAAIQDLNTRFRGKDTPTNVLSFPAPETAAPHLGDIALAYGVCAREAEAQGKSLQHHLMHLTAHGVLHLLGYAHETDAEAEVMEGMERAILATLGVPDPYAEPGAHPDHGADETHAL